MDKPKVITAAAHKLARLIYTMLTQGAEYVDQGQAYYANATAHAYAASGSQHQLRREQLAGVVRVPDVVLHVEAALRALRGAQAIREGQRILLHQAYGRDAGLVGEFLLDFTVEERGLTDWNRVARWAGLDTRRGRAAAKQRRAREQQRLDKR